MTEKEREESDYSYANGKVIGEFVCDRIEDLRYVPTKYYGQPQGTYEQIVCDNSCLTVEEIKEYAKGKPIYGWHISNLKIYDEPKELSEFYKPCEDMRGCFNKQFKDYDIHYTDKCSDCECRVTSPPQNWFYVEEL